MPFSLEEPRLLRKAIRESVMDTSEGDRFGRHSEAIRWEPRFTAGKPPENWLAGGLWWRKLRRCNRRYRNDILVVYSKGKALENPVENE